MYTYIYIHSGEYNVLTFKGIGKPLLSVTRLERELVGRYLGNNARGIQQSFMEVLTNAKEYQGVEV